MVPDEQREPDIRGLVPVREQSTSRGGAEVPPLVHTVKALANPKTKPARARTTASAKL
ncbi:hypothetical protein [Streptomyces sp. NPDC054786]